MQYRGRDKEGKSERNVKTPVWNFLMLNKSMSEINNSSYIIYYDEHF